jgi:hypothetical protein
VIGVGSGGVRWVLEIVLEFEFLLMLVIRPVVGAEVARSRSRRTTKDVERL